MALFDTNAFRISEQGLSVLWQKQQIIAENIANADTPDYNCKYLDFAGIFRDKLRSNGTVDTEIDLVQRLFIDRVTDDQADGNNVDNDVKLALVLSQNQGAVDEQLQGLEAKVIVDVAAVDSDLAGTIVNANAGNGMLTTASAVEIRFGFVHLLLPPHSNLNSFGLLSSMGMVSSLVAVQAGHSLGADGVRGDHALDSVGHGLVAVLSHQGLVLGLLQAADPAGMSAMELLLQLLAGQDSLVAVDDDDVVTAVNVGGESGLVLAAQDDSSLGSNAAEGLAGGVDHIPLAVSHFSGLSESRAHSRNLH